jgi:DNA methyltransferase 1-associated protein 1
MEQPPLIPNEEPKLYKHPKARLRHGVRKWHWVQFKNPARKDDAKFSHWRCVNDDPNKEYPFAKYNKQLQITKYTDVEYSQYLNDENWTKNETDYLMDLCQQFDLRFFVVHDRWDASKFGNAKTRTIDELKDRYYKVIGVMQKVEEFYFYIVKSKNLFY